MIRKRFILLPLSLLSLFCTNSLYAGSSNVNRGFTGYHGVDDLEKLIDVLSVTPQTSSRVSDLSKSSIVAMQNKEDWSFECHKKVFDNKKICYLKNGDLSISLINGQYSVVVGADHQLQTLAGLRIDNSAPMYGYEGHFGKSEMIIDQMKKGKFIYTRYKNKKMNDDIDNKASLNGFTYKLNAMLKTYNEL